jgi:hypothetical protein
MEPAELRLLGPQFVRELVLSSRCHKDIKTNFSTTLDVNDAIEHTQPHTHTHSQIRTRERRLHGRRRRHSFVANARDTKSDELDRGHEDAKRHPEHDFGSLQ